MRTSSAKAVEIPLKDGSAALVDEDDFRRFGWLNWYQSDNGYVLTDTPKPKRNDYPAKTRLHRLIVSCPPGMDVDHINGNRLDNRKENLRVCSRSENLYNKKSSGAYFNKNRNQWFSMIRLKGGKYKSLGNFTTKEAAEAAYAQAHIEINGQHSYHSRSK